MHSTKHIRIMNLGDIITPDISKTLLALQHLIIEKQPDVLADQAKQHVNQYVKNTLKIIENFKLGKSEEPHFTEEMIAEFEKITAIRMTENEFDRCWHAMHPAFDDFKNTLNDALAYSQKPHHQVIFISFTNSKDINNLIHELESKQEHTIDKKGHLNAIGGIRLYSTYVEKKNKAELIESVINDLNDKTSQNDSRTYTPLNLFNRAETTQHLDIKYVRGVNNINDPVLKETLDKTNIDVEQRAGTFFVDTVLWKRFEQPLLSVVLEDQAMMTMQLTAAKL